MSGTHSAAATDAGADHRSGGTVGTTTEIADEESEKDFDEEENELSSLSFEENDVRMYYHYTDWIRMKTMPDN